MESRLKCGELRSSVANYERRVLINTSWRASGQRHCEDISSGCRRSLLRRLDRHVGAIRRTGITSYHESTWLCDHVTNSSAAHSPGGRHADFTRPSRPLALAPFFFKFSMQLSQDDRRALSELSQRLDETHSCIRGGLGLEKNLPGYM